MLTIGVATMGTRYSQFTSSEREELFIMKGAGLTAKEIIKRLGKHKSSFYRELKRNTDKRLGYLPDKAQAKALKRRSFRDLKLHSNKDLQGYVIDKLKEGWSPEMISGRRKREGHPVSVSLECIYQFVYSKEGKKRGLYKYLRMARPKRGTMRGRKPKSAILGRISIHERPAEIEDRKVFGHYEGDLMINQKSMSRNISVVHERKTRFTRIMKNDTKKSTTVMKGMFNCLAQLPPEARKSMTYDNGNEFAKHAILRMIGMQTYFCDAYASWQKGGVENYNRMTRWFLPKNVPLQDVSDHQLSMIEDKINALPRKCLGFRSAAEAFNEEIVALQT